MLDCVVLIGKFPRQTYIFRSPSVSVSSQASGCQRLRGDMFVGLESLSPRSLHPVSHDAPWASLTCRYRPVSSSQSVAESTMCDLLYAVGNVLEPSLDPPLTPHLTPPYPS